MRQPGRGGRCRPRSLGAWPGGSAGTHRSVPVRAGLAGTRVAAAGLRRPAGCLVGHPPTRNARTSTCLPLLELINGVADRAVPMRLRIRPAHCAVWSAWACSLSHRRRALGTQMVAAGSRVAGSW
jgi:hypothetical protein